MLTKYWNLTTAELIRLHRHDIQHDELVDELWLRLEAAEEKEKDSRVATKYTDGTSGHA